MASFVGPSSYLSLHSDIIQVNVVLGHAVILLPAHPASFAHNFVSGMQSFYFSESMDAIVFRLVIKNSVLYS